MGINCLLISTNLVDSPFPVYPLGGAHIVGALESAGHNVTHFDLFANLQKESLGTFLENSKYDLIALSLRNLDTTDSSIPTTFIHHASEVISEVRSLSSAIVAIGGPAFSILPEDIFKKLAPDYGVIGEGENVLPWLADCIETNKLPKKGILRGDCDNNPWRPVSYNKTIAKHYLKFGGMLNIQTKRGCPFNCIYCSYPNLEGNKLRFRDPEEVAEDVKRLTIDLGAKYIFFADAVFNDPQGRYLEICEALIRSGNKTPWCSFFRPAGLTREGISLMKRAGLAAMEFGTDAASDVTLGGLHKGFTFNEVLQANEAAIAEDVPVAHYIIFGGPGEDKDTLAEGLVNIEKLGRNIVFACVGIRILPSTKIFDLAVHEGVCQKDEDLLEPIFYYSPKIESSVVDSTLRNAWKGRLDRLYPWSETQPRIKRMHQRGHLGPIWDLLVQK